MDVSKDYYRILDVSRDATPADIKKAYRKLAHKYHPDVSKEADAETRFKEINAAYEVLGEPKKREEYDRQRAFGAAGARRPSGFGAGGAPGPHSRPHPGAQGGFEWGGPAGGQADWTSFFRQSHGRPFAMRGDDIEATVAITLDQALHGDEVTLNLPNGSTRRVRIPAGARPGGRLRLRGQGEAGVGEGATGDLLLTIRLAPQDAYRVEGADLHRDIPITPWEAALGGGIDVPTPFGRLRVKVPAGTQSGRVLRIPGKGFPGKQPGDLLLHLMVHVPPESEAGDWYRQQAETSTFDPRAGIA